MALLKKFHHWMDSSLKPTNPSTPIALVKILIY